MDNERGNGNGNTVLLTVIGVATLLVALVGATFAYFSATITNKTEQSVVLTTAAPVGLEYVSPKAITMTNIIPGASESGTFTVTNPATSTVAQMYDLELVIDENELNTNITSGATYGDGQTSLPGQLLVTVNGSSTTAGTGGKSTAVTIEECGTSSACDFTDGTADNAKAGSKRIIVKEQRIEIGEVQTYVVNVNFKELDVNQNENKDKAFSAHIEIANATSVR